MTSVLVLGTTGMLGAMVFDVLRRDRSLRVSAGVRDVAAAREIGIAVHAAGMQVIDAQKGDTPALEGVDWVVNCIGITKPYIRDDNRDEIHRALLVNSLFPLRLAEAAEHAGARVLQIATDCVYSGRDGLYDETAAYDATDVYGKSKSLGEVRSPNMMHLRCSIIGPELKRQTFLLAWLLKQQPNATLNGYRNHSWNGVTTLHFAKLCAGIIRVGLKLPQLQHVIPTGDITKADLLRSFAREFNRPDLSIKDTDAPAVIDRRLRTADATTNAALWRAAGHEQPPTVEQMVHELASYSLFS